jgi:hypothetical protein
MNENSQIQNLLKETNLPILRWERRSKRVITVWIDRPTPAYYRIQQPKLRLKGGDGVWRWIKRDYQDDPLWREAWEAEIKHWQDLVATFPKFEFYACYPAKNWIHLTVKCLTL